MTARYVALGDWGTTHLSLGLWDNTTQSVIDVIKGPGIGQLCGKRPEQLVMELLSAWIPQFSINSLVMCGMAGSNKGWVNVPYVECSADLRTLRDQTENFDHNGLSVRLVPGLSCTNALGFYDVMRGEETQILGWLSKLPTDSAGLQTLCLPGTHTKWVTLKNDTVLNFTTSIPGELFAALGSHSVILTSNSADRMFKDEAFRQGVLNSMDNPEAVLSLLFLARSLNLSGHFSDDEAADYLSGVLIGSDVGAACKHFEIRDAFQSIALVGSESLLHRYDIAMQMHGLSTKLDNGTDLAFRGMATMITRAET